MRRLGPSTSQKWRTCVTRSCSQTCARRWKKCKVCVITQFFFLCVCRQLMRRPHHLSSSICHLSAFTPLLPFPFPLPPLGMNGDKKQKLQALLPEKLLRAHKGHSVFPYVRLLIPHIDKVGRTVNATKYNTIQYRHNHHHHYYYHHRHHQHKSPRWTAATTT